MAIMSRLPPRDSGRRSSINQIGPPHAMPEIVYVKDHRTAADLFARCTSWYSTATDTVLNPIRFASKPRDFTNWGSSFY